MPQFYETDSGQILYEAIVAISGGDYTSLKAALDDGKTTIFIRNGTYNESGDANIPDGCVIIGESKNGVVLDYGVDNYGLVSSADSDVYSTGTISVTNNDATVTGVGTGWSEGVNVDVGEFIEIPQDSGNWFEIATVTDATNLELIKNYEGESLSGQNYRIAAFNKNITLKNFTVKGSNGIKIEFHYTSDCLVDNLCIGDDVNATAVFVTDYCHHIVISNSIIKTSGTAIYITSATHIVLENNDLSNCLWGTYAGTGSKYCRIVGNDVSKSDSEGIVVGGNGNHLIQGNTSLDSDSYGIFISSDNNRVIGNHIERSASAGISIDGDYNDVSKNVIVDAKNIGIYVLTGETSNIVANNQIKNPTDYGIHTSGNYTIIIGNFVYSSGSYGIFLSSHSNMVTGNIIDSGVTCGIAVGSAYDYNAITGNLVRNSGIGIYIWDSDCDENVITGNQLNGNTTSITDNGTGTVIVGNAT